jgi:hypothetical protein
MVKNKQTLESQWMRGYGRIKHTRETCIRIRSLKNKLEKRNIKGDGIGFYELLMAADRLANAGMWLVVHDTYARQVYTDGRPLKAEDFKSRPEGHTGGSLNMVPAYAGYLLAGVLSGHTRGWVMEQGHAVSGIDSVNLLTGNLSPEHARRYNLSDAGLSRFVQDFYAYTIDDKGRQASPSCERAYRRRDHGGRLSGVCRFAIRAHAASGRAVGCFFERRGV